MWFKRGTLYTFLVTGAITAVSAMATVAILGLASEVLNEAVGADFSPPAAIGQAVSPPVALRASDSAGPTRAIAAGAKAATSDAATTEFQAPPPNTPPPTTTTEFQAPPPNTPPPTTTTCEAPIVGEIPTLPVVGCVLDTLPF